MSKDGDNGFPGGGSGPSGGATVPTVIQSGGTPLQFWKVLRGWVELYGGPWNLSLRWDRHAVEYELNYGPLGANRTATVQLRVDGSTPGFAFNPVTGRARPLVQRGGALVRVFLEVVAADGSVKVLQAFAGLLGRVVPNGPRWAVEIMGLHRLKERTVMKTTIGRVPVSGANAFPTGAPYEGAPRVYGNFTPEAAPNTLFVDGWTRALESSPDGEFGVGADGTWVAGRPLFAAYGTYTLDGRATNHQATPAGETNAVTDYMIVYESSDPSYTMPPQTATRPGVPSWWPRDTAVLTGSISSSISNMDAVLTGTASGAGSFQMGEGGQASLFFEGSFGGLGGTAVGVSKQLGVSVFNVTGPNGGTVIDAVASGRTSTGFFQEFARERVAVPPSGGNWKFNFDVPADQLVGCTGIQIHLSVRTLLQGAGCQGSFTDGQGGAVVAVKTYDVSLAELPPGWDEPVLLEDGWTFNLPGFHTGPLLAEGAPLPLAGQFVGGTTFRFTTGHGKTLVKTGPLPYKGGGAFARDLRKELGRLEGWR